MRSGRKKKSSTEKEGEYTKKSQGNQKIKKIAKKRWKNNGFWRFRPKTIVFSMFFGGGRAIVTKQEENPGGRPGDGRGTGAPPTGDPGSTTLVS